MTQNPSTDDHHDVPISVEHLEECLDSAIFWVDALPAYADRNQSKADLWSIVAGGLAAVTSLTIFPVLGDGSGMAAKWTVSLVALASAISALVPRVKNYGESAGSARVLAAQYGGVYGKLLDLIADRGANQTAARAAISEFNSTKEKKDALRHLTPWIRKRNDDKKKHDPGRP